MIDVTDKTKSTEEVQVDEEVVVVEYWWSWRNQLTESEFNDYLQLEALKKLKRYSDARQFAEPKATGVFTETEYGLDDTRNWYQNWIDNNL